MYDLIEQIISHLWDADSLTQEQEYIFMICGALIILITIWILDAISAFIINFGKKGGK